MSILLSTLNARYIHASLGLRYLIANMGALRPQTQIVEFTINLNPIEIVEQIIKHKPKIIGFGVYIWNVEQTTRVIALLKTIEPKIIIVVGGPEVSHEYNEQRIVGLSDYVITGYADISFHALCVDLLNHSSIPAKIIHGKHVTLDQINLPYDYYSDDDVANRICYIEASRGCPFKCEFCISSLDKTAWPFELDEILSALNKLYARGVRHFKFVDRTFNLKIESSMRIMEFFLAKEDPSIFLHFELIPDHLPQTLKKIITRFKPGMLQFEIGVQSLDPGVQQNISRTQNNQKTIKNLIWLRSNSSAHLHADLILGLPGDDIEKIERGFNTLFETNPHEIQVGVLKRLKGTPIIRHTMAYHMKYNPYPPFDILSTNKIDFYTMRRLSVFARYWDIVINSGRFLSTRNIMLTENPFQQFLKFSDWLYIQTGQTHSISLARLFGLIYQYLVTSSTLNKSLIEDSLLTDFNVSGIKGFPPFIKNRIKNDSPKDNANYQSRQKNHLNS